MRAAVLGAGGLRELAGAERGEIEARRTHPPECCVDPDLMFAELERHGVQFDITTTNENTQTEETPA